ncbi:glycosyltransferase [Halorubrum sp. DTA46]|uniref:glycosyltransferase n=1 Tax=Halorubrum sp. DTA46 TaxID=3402162 RepID=UPI003AAE6D9D
MSLRSQSFARIGSALDELLDSEAERDEGDPHDDPPLVSVVITTYNRPNYLRESVQSILAQTYEPIELVVVDDCSDTPATETLSDADLSSLSASTCVRHRSNRGANAARNTGIRASSGKYIAFLDDDDRWKPEKVARQVEAFEAADDDVGVAYTGIETIRKEGHGVEIPPRIDGDLTKSLLCRNDIGTMSVVMVRATVANEISFDEEFEAWADLEWFIRLSTAVEFVRIPEPLTVYEYTSHGRLSDDFEKKRRSYERFLDRFDDLAAEYGWLFHRKMRAWAAFRVGSAALYTGHYAEARRYLSVSVSNYPFEPRFLNYWVVALGGGRTHRLARRLSKAVKSLARTLPT